VWLCAAAVAGAASAGDGVGAADVGEVAGAASAAGSATTTADPSSDVRIDEPRAFGHFIGDPLDRSIEITVPAGYTLAPESLPKPQREGAWLELQSVRSRWDATARGRRVRVDLHYQVINSPASLLQTVLPGMTLHFIDGAGSFDRVIDEFPLVVSPLARGSAELLLTSMRPSRVPLMIDAGRWKWLLAAAAATAALFMAAATGRRLSGLIQARGHGPFDRAHRTLRALGAAAPGVERHRAALRAVHRAFDETAGIPVFAEGLDAFFDARPAFAAARAPVRAFYAASRLEFFGGGNDRDDMLRIERLVSLCAQLRACERQARG
jgi:mxaA protein